MKYTDEEIAEMGKKARQMTRDSHRRWYENATREERMEAEAPAMYEALKEISSLDNDNILTDDENSAGSRYQSRKLMTLLDKIAAVLEGIDK